AQPPHRRRRQRNTVSLARDKEGRTLAALAQPKRPWPDPEPPDLAVPAGMRRERFRAMGTTISLLLPAPRASAGTAAVQALFAHWGTPSAASAPRGHPGRSNGGAGPT